MSNFAVIETGGKQYWVKPGMKIQIERLAPSPDGKAVFDRVLLVERDGTLQIGTPHVPKAHVEALTKDVRGERKMVYRFHSKTRYRKKRTHRQPLSEVEITKII